ncbi:hypothetical protein [Pelosinus propionicus]|uniref:Uncharacterized protein n=1 Tax=Pelosinus propionicus DSM 13327 TaxID=1123291 RepID=A0A1I4JGF0_9FIRM|nr:hypothetical protein [Pelosinus propionicus]SFL65594.1 hypothetical protein SAMN04490355_101267 [Pelosinus propionicus DSM 13327]
MKKEIEKITDETMIRIILKGINKDGQDGQDMSNPQTSFIKSEPISNSSCIAIYQANVNNAYAYDNEELPDFSKYTYNVFVFDDSVLTIHKNCTEVEARAVYKECGVKFWLDR